MRALLVALLFLPVLARGDDDLFTGVPPEKVPADVQSFLSTLKRAFDSGDANSVMTYAVTPETTGTGFYFLRQRLAGINKERKVKKIELVAAVAEADVEDKRNGVTFRPATKPTHTVVARLEGAPGDVAIIELPAAKTVHPTTNREIWRLMTPIPLVPGGESVRLAEAKALAEKYPDVLRYQIELATLHALLGNRKEVEPVEARLRALAEGKAVNQASYIHTQLGWIRFHLRDSKQALESFKKGHELADGKVIAAEFGLAVGLHAEGQFPAAARHYDHAAGQAPAYSDRESLEKLLKNSQPAEREAILAVQALWLRVFVPANRFIAEP